MNAPSPIINTERISVALEKLGLEWADTNAAAEALEETRSSVSAQIAARMINAGDSATKAALVCKGDAEYRDHIKHMVEARRVANRARVRYDVYRVKAELIRSNASTERALASIR